MKLAYVKLEFGETIQGALVRIANSLGDCDDAADLAEIHDYEPVTDEERSNGPGKKGERP